MKKVFENKRSGFTLIELLVVATIIIVLTSIGLISYRQAGYSSRNGKRKSDLEVMRQSLMLYKADEGCFPDDSDFDDMKTTLTNAGYLSEGSGMIEDPKDDQSYDYTPGNEVNGCYKTFTLEATLEPDGDTHQVLSP